MKLIRTNNIYGFRCGEWATLVGTEMIKDRECYSVRFPSACYDMNGRSLPSADYWVVDDPQGKYEFAEVVE